MSVPKEAALEPVEATLCLECGAKLGDAEACLKCGAPGAKPTLEDHGLSIRPAERGGGFVLYKGDWHLLLTIYEPIGEEGGSR